MIDLNFNVPAFQRSIEVAQRALLCVPMPALPVVREEPKRCHGAACIVSRRNETGDFRPILVFPRQPRRAKGEPIAPPVIDVDHLRWLDYLAASGSTKCGHERALDLLA